MNKCEGGVKGGIGSWNGRWELRVYRGRMGGGGRLSSTEVHLNL